MYHVWKVTNKISGVVYEGQCSTRILAATLAEAVKLEQPLVEQASCVVKIMTVLHGRHVGKTQMLRLEKAALERIGRKKA